MKLSFESQFIIKGITWNLYTFKNQFINVVKEQKTGIRVIEIKKYTFRAKTVT